MPPSTNRPIYGIRAVDAVFKKRPQEIRKVYLTQKSVKYFSPLLKFCSAKKLPYKIVSEEELGKVAKSTHNEGICLITKDRLPLSFEDFSRIDLPGIIDRSKAKREVVLYLDGVENPHNLGSIVRIASFFGVKFIISPPGESFRLSGAVCRVAEGGGEYIEFVSSTDPTKNLARLKKEGFSLVATSANAKSSIFKAVKDLPARVVLLIGSERSGLSKEIEKLATLSLMIPGAGEVNSLNVSTATAICLAEITQR